jgi:negative regulator of flagellin synthesis FlgM
MKKHMGRNTAFSARNRRGRAATAESNEQVNIMAIKINGDRGIDPLGGVRKSQKTQNVKGAEKRQTTDRVDFSSVLQEMNQAKETTSTSGTARMEKVQALKEQVVSGNYRPDLRKVAASLLRFLVRGR